MLTTNVSKPESRVKKFILKLDNREGTAKVTGNN